MANIIVLLIMVALVWYYFKYGPGWSGIIGNPLEGLGQNLLPNLNLGGGGGLGGGLNLGGGLGSFGDGSGLQFPRL